MTEQSNTSNCMVAIWLLVCCGLVFAMVALGLLYGNQADSPHPWYRKTLVLTWLIILTVISGGFVAGLKAGIVYNTFPLMGDQWIPYGMFVLDPAWRNFFDNMVTAQFDHRLLAIGTLLLVITYWFKA
jgi:cytochrome c oxidase assembly protein subunit 15